MAPCRGPPVFISYPGFPSVTRGYSRLSPAGDEMARRPAPNTGCQRFPPLQAAHETAKLQRHPGGMPESSRGLSEAIPPDSVGFRRALKGCHRNWPNWHLGSSFTAGLPASDLTNREWTRMNLVQRSRNRTLGLGLDGSRRIIEFECRSAESESEQLKLPDLP